MGISFATGIFVLISALLLAGCGQGQEALPPSPTPASSAALIPMAPPVLATPSPTPRPTFTPAPTSTATPAPAILPTVTRRTPTPAPAPADPLTATLDSLSSQASVLRQLFSESPPERHIIGREELRRRLRDEFEEDREDIGKAQELYQTLGIMDKNVDLYDLLLKIYGTDVLGFFDTKEKKLFVVTDAPELSPSDKVTYVHEFVHGLQQQHFDIDATDKALKDNNDRSLAFDGLVEGDATIAETIYTFQYLDEKERAAAQAGSTRTEPGPFDTAPHLVQRLITFPYEEGFQFVVALFLQSDRTWKLVNGAFQDLPQSTEQVLHPEKYLSKEAPKAAELPELATALGAGWSQISRDTLGEFFLRAYMEDGVPPELASAAAEGWGGDSYVHLKASQGRRLLVSQIAWDSEADAKEFFDAFLGFMEVQKGAAWKDVGRGGKNRLMELPGQSIYLRLDQTSTLLIFTPDIPTLETARAVIERK